MARVERVSQQQLSSQRPLALAYTGAALLSIAFFPVFLFSVYKNEEPLTIPLGLQRLSLAATIGFSIICAADMMGLADILKQYSANSPGLRVNPSPRYVAFRLLSVVSGLSYLLLLIAFFRAPNPDPATNQNPSKVFDIVNRIAVILCGVQVLIGLVITGVTPYLIWSHAEEIRRSGQDPHIVRGMLTGPLRILLNSACIFAAPYIVSMSRRNRPQPLSSDAEALLAYLEETSSREDSQSGEAGT